MHETRTIANWVANLRYEDIPEDVREHARRFILDTAPKLQRTTAHVLEVVPWSVAGHRGLKNKTIVTAAPAEIGVVMVDPTGLPALRMGPTWGGGASGAIYGIVVAFAFLFPNSKLMLLIPPVPIKAKYLVPLLILGDLFFGFTSASIGNIAHFAHIGGAITGFLMMWYWKRNRFNRNRWRKATKHQK